MTIRPYTPSDSDSVLILLHLNTPQYFAPEEEKDLADYLENHLDLYYAVEENGRLIGCGGGNRSADGNSAVLSWDIIHPNSQGKGVGSTLTKFRIQQLQNLGIQNIGVRTSQHAFKFYEKMGFKLLEIYKDYWAPGFDMYKMELE